MLQTNLWQTLRVMVWGLLALPFAGLMIRLASANLGPNPTETLSHETGLWALRILLLCLAMTPLSQLTGSPLPIRLRRMIGLYAFFYASAHLLIYLVFDQQFAPGAILADIAKRPYLTAGFAAFLLLLPLAATSTRRWVRRLGPAWKRLHRLIYPAACLAVLHFFWQVKADLREPLIYGLALGLLLAARLPWRSGYRRLRSAGRG